VTKSRCEGCKFFNCGDKCKCKCHYGSSPKIRTNHNVSDLRRLQKHKTSRTEEQAMEGLSNLFG